MGSDDIDEHFATRLLSCPDAGYSPLDPHPEPPHIAVVTRRPSRWTRLLLGAIIAAGIAVAGCGAPGTPGARAAPGATIDGFTLGVLAACSPPVGPTSSAATAASCARYPALAAAALDARDPGHAAIVATTSWTDGTQPGPIDVTGNGPPPTAGPRHPGPNVIVFVFQLADASIRATGVVCPDAPPCVGVGSYPL